MNLNTLCSWVADLPIYYLLLCYVLGSIPSALLITKAIYNIDIRQHGSGNIGATNVVRTVGKKLGIVIFFLDGLKGAIPTAITMYQYHHAPWTILAALTSILGHIFPIWLKFKGGKGVSTTLFCFIVIDYRIAIIAGITWLAIYLSTKYVSLASVAAILASLISSIVIYRSHEYRIHYIGFFLLVSLLVIGKHHTNLKRIQSSQEFSF